MIKLVILDFYGVLYSNFDWSVVDKRIAVDEGKAQKFSYLKNLSNRGKISNFEFRNEVAKLAGDHHHKDNPAVLNSPKINSDIMKIIKEILPKAKIVLLSNGNKPDVFKQLEECGIIDDFDHIYTSSDMNFLKPQIGAYKTVFKELGVSSEEAIIIDDSPNHTAATKSYGFKTIKFIDNQALKRDLKNYKT